MTHSSLPAAVILSMVLLCGSISAAFAQGNGNGNGNAGGNGNGNGSAGGNGNGAGNGNGGGNGNAGSNGNSNGVGNGNAGGNENGGGNDGNGNPAGGVGDAPRLAGGAMLDQDRALAAVESHQAVPLETIVATISQSGGGEVIDARLVEVRGFLLYEVKVLDDGHVEVLHYYAKSGRPVAPVQ